MSFDTNYSLAYRPTLSLQRPPSPPLPPYAHQAPPPSSQRANHPPRLHLASVTTTTEAPPVALFVQPASPALSSPGSFATPPEPSPPPGASSSFLPPAPSGLGGGLAARRQLNKKSLSLVVPNAPAASSLLSPTTPCFLQPNGSSSDADETRSLPPSPISLQAFIGAEGTEEEDRTIGRLMMKQQADEMREQMKGGRGMKRRTSIPRLNLAAPAAGKLGGGGKPAPLNLGSTNGGSAVQLLRRDNVERAGAELSSSKAAGEEEEVAEEFPYALGPREILPGLYLGSEQNARDPAVLKEWGISHVLNVAKEVECPWVDDVIAEEDEEEEEEMEPSPAEPATQDSPSVSFAPSNTSTSPSRARPKHRRTKTQAAFAAPEVVNAPPLFVRPTASTPNLQSIFNASNAFPPPPAVPPLPQDLDALDDMAMARSLSSSPPQPRRSPPRSRTSLQLGVKTTAPTTAADGAIRFPASARSGRPPLEYLWLKVSLSSPILALSALISSFIRSGDTTNRISWRRSSFNRRLTFSTKREQATTAPAECSSTVSAVFRVALRSRLPTACARRPRRWRKVVRCPSWRLVPACTILVSSLSPSRLRTEADSPLLPFRRLIRQGEERMGGTQPRPRLPTRRLRAYSTRRPRRPQRRGATLPRLPLGAGHGTRRLLAPRLLARHG